MSNIEQTNFTPTPEQLAAIENFKSKFSKSVCKSKGYADWRDALKVSWMNGTDTNYEGGAYLRQLRNTQGAHEWLDQQDIQAPKKKKATPAP